MNKAKLTEAAKECWKELSKFDEAALKAKDLQLDFLKAKIREQVHYDSANSLRGSSGYSPSAIKAEVDRRMEALEQALKDLRGEK
jgi:hypothetical protein